MKPYYRDSLLLLSMMGISTAIEEGDAPGIFSTIFCGAFVVATCCLAGFMCRHYGIFSSQSCGQANADLEQNSDLSEGLLPPPQTPNEENNVRH